MKSLDKNLNLLDDFPYPDFDVWLKEVEKSLKGKTFDKIKTPTYEGIIKEPIYTNSNINNDIPSFSPFRRGYSPTPYKIKPWKINIEIIGSSAKDFNENLKENISRGVTSVRMNLTEEYLNKRYTVINDINDLKDAFNNVNLVKTNIIFSFSNNYEHFISLIDEFATSSGINPQNIIIDLDPLEKYVLDVKKNTELYKFYDFIFENSYGNYKYVLSSSAFKESGCSIIQELSLILSKLIDILNYLYDNKYDINAFLKNLVIQFKTGNDFFLELAKYRAFRILWYNFVKAYEIDDDFFPIIYTKSLRANKSFLDYHTNILRNTIEAFSAIVGGVDILELAFFDDFYKDNISEFSQRVTRNIQILLQEEFNLSEIIDPAGGSYYVENLTDELVRKSWDYFKVIQSNGGLINSIHSNIIQNEIANIKNQKVKNFSLRKEVLIGVNKYPSLSDDVIDLTNSNVKLNSDFEPLSFVRYAEPFEKLRLKSLQYQKEFGKKPLVFVATYGKLSQYKARLDFINDYFNVGGIKTKISVNSDDISQIFNEFSTSQCKIIVFCASDEIYEDFLPEIIPLIKKSDDNYKLILAGYPKEKVEQYKSLGIDEFIHINSNIIEVLNKVYNWL